MRVILTLDKHRHTVEVTVHSPHLDLAATEESGDAAVYLSTAMDKLTPARPNEHVGKLRVRKGGARRPHRVRAHRPGGVSAPAKSEDLA